MSTILYDRTPPMVRITINRPEAMNAFDLATADAMARRFEEFDGDAELRVAIVTGAGDKAFCAGADLKKMYGGSRVEGATLNHGTEDSREGPRAFAEKRSPQFKGR